MGRFQVNVVSDFHYSQNCVFSAVTAFASSNQHILPDYNYLLFLNLFLVTHSPQLKYVPYFDSYGALKTSFFVSVVRSHSREF